MSKTLLLCHGDKHSLVSVFDVASLKITIEDVKQGRVDTLDKNSGCCPSIVADFSKKSGKKRIEKRSYDVVATIHCPFRIWLNPEDKSLNLNFFRNCYAALSKNGTLILEIPIAVNDLLVLGMSWEDYHLNLDRRERASPRRSISRAAMKSIARYVTGNARSRMRPLFCEWRIYGQAIHMKKN